MEEEKLTPGTQERAPVPCRPLLFSACRRLVGASCRDFALKPDVTVKALMAGLDFLGVKEGDRPFAPWVDLSVEAADFGQKMVYPEESTPHPDYADPLIKDVSDYRKLKRVDLKTAPRMQNLLVMIRALIENGAIGIGGFCLGPLGVLSMMRGAERLFRDCVLHPLEVKAAMETITGTLIEFVEDRPGHDRRYAMNIQKMETELDWKPSQDLESGLRQTVAWYLENPDWIEALRGEVDYQEWIEQNYGRRGEAR